MQTNTTANMLPCDITPLNLIKDVSIKAGPTTALYTTLPCLVPISDLIPIFFFVYHKLPFFIQTSTSVLVILMKIFSPLNTGN